MGRRRSSAELLRHGVASAAVLDAPAVQRAALDAAVHGLARARPELSAATPFAAWQRRAAIASSLLLSALIGMAPGWGGNAAALLLAIPFLLIVLIRLAALWHLAASGHSPAAAPPLTNPADLSHYSVLVPLYDEVAVAPALVTALAALDYPEGRLEILFITEEDDEPTRRALRAGTLQPYMQILTVPDGSPKTKPRALNYALQFATGDYIAVYDAEDIPAPDQLRLAVAAFANGGTNLACVQARLNIYNPGASLLTRQFTLEYAALFDAMLPALDKLGLPLPLGGTSNHFRRDHLLDAGAWDPYNVTEDADLGFRLARQGKRVEMLASTTWEEAPAEPRAWLGQRTRWLKGWMQTYLVHMRDPLQLWRDLGAWRFFGFQVTLGGMVLSALVHPWFYLLLAGNILAGRGAFPAGNATAWLCWSVLASGYVSAMALVALAVKRRGGSLLTRSALWLPIYWLAISLAAYRALVELFIKPSYWQKTPHGPRGVTMPSIVT